LVKADRAALTKPPPIRCQRYGRRVSAVIEGQHRAEAIKKIIEEYDATPLVGLHTVVISAAMEREDEDGEKIIELPKLRELIASP
jgi:hypothetical protein